MMLASVLLVAALSTPAPRQTYDAGILAVREFGTYGSRPLILIPGLACGPWVWDRQVAALSPKYDVYAVTLPGFDGRPMIEGNDLMRRAVDSVHALIASRHLVNVAVIGHSLGGTIAVMFAQTYPSDAANVVTVEGGYPEAPTQKLRDERVATEIAPYEHVTQAQLPNALRDNMLQYTITKKDDVNRATALAGRSDPGSVVAWMKAGLSLDLTPGLSRIGTPFTAIIPFDAGIDPYVGFKSAADKLHVYTVWVAHAHMGKVILINGSRHFVMIDQPKKFEGALERAISRLR